MTEYVGAIEKQTLANTYFRKVLFTAPHSQLVLMCLRLTRRHRLGWRSLRIRQSRGS